MPTPHKDERKSDYISRAIRQLREEGREQKQAIAIAHSMWDEYQKEQGESDNK